MYETRETAGIRRDRKAKDTMGSSPPIWVAHWIRTNSAETGSMNKDEITEAVNPSLRLSSNSVENRGSFGPVIEQSKHYTAGSGIQFPHWIPDNIRFSSNRGYTLSEGASVSHPELMKISSTAINTAALTLQIRPPFENLMPEREETTLSLSEKTRSTGFMRHRSDYQQPIYGPDSLKKTLSSHDLTLLPSEDAGPFEIHESGKYNLRTTRVCTTTVDSVEAIPEGYRRYSQTTHNLFTTTKADVDLSKQSSTFRTSALIELSGNKSSNNIQSLSPFLAQGSSTALKLEELSSHSNVPGTGPLNVELRSGVDAKFASSNKDHRDAITSHEMMEKKKLLTLPAEKKCRVSPITRNTAVDLESKLLEDDNRSESDPSDRWVKRLKQSSPSSSKLSEGLSHDKAWNFSSSTSSVDEQSVTRRPHGKEPVACGKIPDMRKEDELPTEKCKEMLLSHSWIKRLQKDGSKATLNTQGTAGFSEPHCSKPEQDEFPKKPFPSIAALALVGRSMKGVRSCEIQKKGPITLWHTNPL